MPFTVKILLNSFRLITLFETKRIKPQSFLGSTQVQPRSYIWSKPFGCGSNARHHSQAFDRVRVGDDLRKVMRQVPSPVAVITTCDPSNPSILRGVTVGSFTSVSLSPPIVSFALKVPSRFSELLHKSNRFVVQILSADQVGHSATFSSAVYQKGASQKSTNATNTRDIDPIDDIPHYLSEQGCPVLVGSVGVIHCVTERVVLVGDHEVWMGAVQKAYEGLNLDTKKLDSGEDDKITATRPLLYYNGKYRGVGEELFMKAFEEKTSSVKEWTHRAHVRMAWNQLRELGKEKATPLICSGIRAYLHANRKQLSRPYNETVTRAFIELVSKALENDQREEKRKWKQEGQPNYSANIQSGSGEFGDFLERYPILANRHALLEFYKRETLNSEEAKERWIEPDVKPLPDMLEAIPLEVGVVGI